MKNKKLIKELQEVKERNALLENALEEIKNKVGEVSKLVGAKQTIDEQKQFYTSIPDDEL